MNTFTALETQPVENLTFPSDRLNTPFNGQLLDNSEPALQLMHNFMLQPIQHIEYSSNIDEASIILKRTHNKVSFVIDAKDNIVGLISRAILGSRHILATAKKLNCQRCDLCVGDIMLPIDKLQQTTMSQVEQSNMGNILTTMQKTGAEFLLVTDNTRSLFMGYFDNLELSKASGTNLNTMKHVNNFSDMIGTILHHTEM